MLHRQRLAEETATCPKQTQPSRMKARKQAPNQPHTHLGSGPSSAAPSPCTVQVKRLQSPLQQLSTGSARRQNRSRKRRSGAPRVPACAARHRRGDQCTTNACAPRFHPRRHRERTAQPRPAQPSTSAKPPCLRVAESAFFSCC